ncbi:glycosyltransferase [Leekyejoonella antrihumi]|uniref:Glycosyltransferase n=1 Tax=Leekyejoonella antrihumi TaxID=1660198 RepID=A0A563DW79_9MICO|nr:glycosyltransferase [Leekyejoonella antrihumi]TWP34231.1 glycosyltransferase [Leekyejoonella antrihumi]
MAHIAPALPRSPERRTPRATSVDIVVPVYNEQDALADCVLGLRNEIAELPYRVQIVVVDNASTDCTGEIGRSLADAYPDVSYRRLQKKGRGHALASVWQDSPADLCAYMDVDLSTDLAALAPALAVLATGHSDLSVGSRLSQGSRVQRGMKREMISRTYNLTLKLTLGTRYSDAQCGFKAIRRDAAQALLPHISDTGWFFDTELLTLAEWSGLRIHEIPVDWRDDPISSVDILATASADLRGIARMLGARLRGRYPLAHIAAAAAGRQPSGTARLGLAGQLVSFCMIGALSTMAFAQLGALVAANLLATVVRFVLFRHWVFRRDRSGEDLSLAQQRG